jgi:hypothetical protein
VTPLSPSHGGETVQETLVNGWPRDEVSSLSDLFRHLGIPVALGVREDVFPPGRLGFSKEQKESVQQAIGGFYRQTRELRYTIEQKRLTVKRLFTDSSTDQAVLTVYQHDLSLLWGRLFEGSGRLAIETRKLLKPEQLGALERFSEG